MIINFRSFVAGLRSYMPFLMKQVGEGRGEMSARYCYTVWLRHLVCASQNGLQSFPSTLLELGPGSSLGVGLAALLSGVDRYVALDAVPFSGYGGNEKVLDELVDMFRMMVNIPDDSEFPEVFPKLESYDFPHEIIPYHVLRDSLAPDRILSIKRNLTGGGNHIEYHAPWDCVDCIEGGSADMIVSQAVLEHVEDLESAYCLMSKWLKPGGIMSHSIDFGSHGLSKFWNGHWACADFMWRIVVGKRSFLINRQPCSHHFDFLEKSGFKVLGVERVEGVDGLLKGQLAKHFRNMSDKDAMTRGAYILSIKTEGGYEDIVSGPMS